MVTVIPVDEFVTPEWYPGFRPSYGHAPWIADPVNTFRRQDAETYWFLDFHWPRGMTPMGMIWNEDGYNWGTQFAAQTLPLPPGHGITSRFAGTHVYASALPVTDPRERAARARRLAKNLPVFLAGFDGIWADRREEIEEGWRHFRSLDLTTLDRDGLCRTLIEARAFHKRAFEIHFEVMYPLLATFIAFSRQCERLGLDPDGVGAFFQGYDTKIMETDRELWRLTRRARAAGLAPVFATAPAEGLRTALAAHGGAAGAWLAEFDDFLQVYGWRTEGTCDIALPSWVEDPTPALGTIKTFLQGGTEHDFEAAAAAAVAARESAIDGARARLTRQEQAVFDAGLTACTAANFTWWQDDHNYYIDLRVALPMRWVCQELATRLGTDAPDDTLFTFWPENLDLLRGERDWAELRGLVAERRQYFDHWHARRRTMPRMLGTVPDRVDDPILIEIFGLNEQYLRTIRAGGAAPTSGSDPTGSNHPTDSSHPTGSSEQVGGTARPRVLAGVAAAGGRARGVARVLSDADDLHRIETGEVLVCESTSPNWTPAFAKIAAAVCDGGGTLSHAAIVGREYGVPTVTAVGLATSLIRDGDLLEVDGTAGTVTILTPAPPR